MRQGTPMPARAKHKEPAGRLPLPGRAHPKAEFVMLKGSRSMVLRYGVAVLTVELALLLKFLLDPFIAQETSPFLLFFGPVMISAWYGGMAAGVLATSL